MALCQLPSAACTIHKLAPSPPSFLFPDAQDLLPRWATFLVRPPRRSVALACFAKKPRATRKPKSPKINMTNDELCKELRAFVSEQGLPANRLPSMAEISRRGRKDLANLVRKRGYKIIAKFFENQMTETLEAEANLPENQEPISANIYRSSESQSGGFETLNEGASSDLSSMKNYVHNGNGACTILDEPSELFERNLQAVVSLRHHEELNNAQGNYTVNNSYASHKNHRTSNLSYVESGLFVTQRSTSFPSEQLHSENTQGDDISSDEEENMAGTDTDLTSEAVERDKQREIDRLRAMLNEKEVELQRLKQEIEKEKLALSNLQRKTRAEIDNIQSLISAKEEELRAAEEGLFGLKEVQVEFQVHGESVELTGSFNGWQHRIKMDRQTFSDGQTTMDTRNSALWSTTLWLYPGVYEIKFVVDDHWRTDPQRESVTKGHITNNILRVE